MGESLKDYPQGRGAPVSRYIKNTLVEFGVAKALRARVTVAQLNAGLALLPALPGVRWRLFAASFIAIGGAATTSTDVRIQGLVSASATNLWIVTVAALTQSTQLFTGVTPAAGAQTLLADGASFTRQDANAAVNIVKTGASMTVMTNIDVFLDYVADPQ